MPPIGKRFQPGHHGGNVGRGRPHALADPEMAEKVATAFVGGCTREQMAEMFGVSTWTITQWRKDPRIKPYVFKMIEDRVVAVTRKVDSAIEARLQTPENLTVKELLEIRKEFLAGTLRQKMESIDDETMGEAMQLLEKYPELADQMVALMSGQAVVVPKDQVIEGGLITEPQDGIHDTPLGDDDAS